MPKVDQMKNSLIRYNLAVMLAIVVGVATVLTRGLFLQPGNLLVVAARASVVGLIALGQSLVIISGGFDLSVGSLLLVTITLIATFKSTLGLVAASLLGIASAASFGVLNGLMITQLSLPPFIVTLGMMSIARSVAWMTIAGKDIRVYEYKNIISPIFDFFDQGTTLFPIIVFLLTSVCIGVFLHRSKIGRYIFAVGANERTAIASGVPVKRVKILVYMISGLLSGVAAITYLYRVPAATPGAGEEFLLPSLAGPIVGGVYLYGGEGTIPGVVVGVLILEIISNLLTVAGFPPLAHKAILGAIIVVIALFQQWARRSEVWR